MGHRRTTITRQCERCDRDFHPWTNRPGRYCSLRCSTIARQIEQGKPLWTPEENQFLEDRCGSEAFPKLVKQLQAYQKRRGLTVRTKEAIASQIKRLGLSRRCLFDNLNGSEFAAALGVSPARLRHWVLHCNFPFDRLTLQTAQISLKKFRDWAAHHPHLLSDLDRDNLLWLLQDDAALVDRILATPRPGKGQPCPVRRLDTGETYPTIAAAARSIYVAAPALRQAIEENRECVGVRFVRLK